MLKSRCHFLFFRNLQHPPASLLTIVIHPNILVLVPREFYVNTVKSEKKLSARSYGEKTARRATPGRTDEDQNAHIACSQAPLHSVFTPTQMERTVRVTGPVRCGRAGPCRRIQRAFASNPATMSDNRPLTGRPTNCWSLAGPAVGRATGDCHSSWPHDWHWQWI